MRIILFLSLLIFMVPAQAAQHYITMFGEPKYGTNFTHFDYVNPDAPKGGKTTMGVIGHFDSLNQFILKGVPAAGVGYLYDSLMVGSDDEPFSQYGLIAKTVEIAPDKSSVTFYLREEARFHDGMPITAEDVVFTFNSLMEKGHPRFQAYYQEISTAKALDKHTVQFTFSNPNNRELPFIIAELPVLPKHYYDTHAFDQTTLTPPLGSGPYTIKALEPGRWITYERNRSYWAKNLPVNKGRYNFDIIHIDYYRDATVAVEAFKSGEFDLREENISKTWANAYDFPAVKKGHVKKEMIDHDIPSGMQAFVFNTRRSKFNHYRIREALNYAFDFEWENKNLFYGVYSRTRSYFQNSVYAAEGHISDAEYALLKPYEYDINKRIIKSVYNPPVTDGSGNNRKHLLHADKLLNSVGWIINEDMKRVNKKTGEVMTIEFLLNSPSFERVVAPMLKNLKKLGIEARMRTVDPAQYIKRLEEFDFDIVVNVWGQSNSPGNEQHNYWYSSQAQIKGSRNLAGIEDPVVDDMISKIINAKTKEELITACRALDRVLQWGFYVIPNWYLGKFRIVYWDKYGHPTIQPNYDLGFDNWWVDIAKEARLERNGSKK